MIETALLCSEGIRELDYGEGHPFRGTRFITFPEFLSKMLPENGNYKLLGAEPATDEDLYMICSPEYVNFTREFYKGAASGLGYTEPFGLYHTMDNMPGDHPGQIEEAARLVTGQARKAANLVQAGEYKKVICLGNGMHHAKPSHGEGFCIYNDVAFAARYLVQQHKLDRVMILDTDAHAGNGTCEYFYPDDKVLFMDIHQDPSTIYPGTGYASQIGEGKGKGFTVNIPLPPGADYNSYILAFEDIVKPVVTQFEPQIIIRNGGSDPHFDDCLTNLGLTIAGLRMIGSKVREISNICDGRVIDMIASGYNEDILPYGWLALIVGLGDFKVDIPEPVPPPQYDKDRIQKATQKAIQEVKNSLRDYWTFS
jgi:acetoin utilization protein AcuC